MLGGVHEGDGWTQNREVLQGHEIPLVEGVNSLTPSKQPRQIWHGCFEMDGAYFAASLSCHITHRGPAMQTEE